MSASRRQVWKIWRSLTFAQLLQFPYHSEPVAGSVIWDFRSRNWILKPMPTWTNSDGTISTLPARGIQVPYKTFKSVSYEGESLTIRMLAKHPNSIRDSIFVPCNMTVHQPGSRIISGVCDNEPAATLELSNIAARRIREAQLVEISSHAELARPCAQNITVVTVEVNRMGNRRRAGGLLDHPVRPLDAVSLVPCT